MNKRTRFYIVSGMCLYLIIMGGASAIADGIYSKYGIIFFLSILSATAPFAFIFFFLDKKPTNSKQDFYNNFLKDYTHKFKENFKNLKITEFYNDLLVISFFDILLYLLLYPLLLVIILFLLNFAYIEFVILFYIYSIWSKIINIINAIITNFVSLFNINLSKLKNPIRVSFNFQWLKNVMKNLDKKIVIKNDAASKILDEIKKSKKDH